MIHAHEQTIWRLSENAEAFPSALTVVFVLGVILFPVQFFKIKEVIDTLFLLPNAHQLLRRALRFYANPQTQTKEK